MVFLCLIMGPLFWSRAWWNGGLPIIRSRIPKLSPRWKRGWRRFGPGPHRNWCGCWNTRRSIRRAPALGPGDLLEPARFPVYPSGRGGQFTYHGPGQRVAYVMLDLARRGPDVRGFVCALESWLIRALARFNIKGETRAGRVGIWVDRGSYGGLPGQEDKIAALGVRVRRWVTFHGVALNVEPDLSHFSGIVPCGLRAYGVTSMHALGHLVTMPEVDAALKACWEEAFGDQGVHPWTPLGLEAPDPGPWDR